MDLKSLRLLLKALGEDTRLRVLYLLSVRSLTVGEMARILRVAQPSLSKHLARLRELGLVTDRRQGMHVFYHAVRSRPAGALVSDLVRMIRSTAVCRGDLSPFEAGPLRGMNCLDGPFFLTRIYSLIPIREYLKEGT